ncbi:serine protease MucD [Aurantivibrio plasticivorans]
MKRFVFVLVVLSVIFPALAQARGALPDFADLIEKKTPAVVKITTMTTVAGRGNPYQGQELPEFFKRFLDPRQMPERNVGGMGSGFIISEDGYVLTNNHVVEGASEINVRLLDNREFDAEVIGADPRSDLALLKIDADDLPYLAFANDEELRVGDWVLAIGSPFGLDFSASQGIVSAIGRSIRGDTNGSYVPFIQTDVAINPGNSGGPLFNLDGEVVGINSQIYTRSGGYMGLSFAIPSSLAQSVVAQLKDKGHVDRGWLGVSISDMSRDLAEAFGLKKPAGALVEMVVPGGPAEGSGLRAGDVILKFDGEKIAKSSDLPPVVGATEPDTKVDVEIMREGKAKTLEVVVGTLDSNVVQAAGSATAPPTQDSGRLGVVVEEASPDLLSSNQVSGGVVVNRVEPDSPAAASGLQPGDVIVQIGFKDVTNIESFQTVEATLPSNSLLPIRFFRRGQPAFRTIVIKD